MGYRIEASILLGGDNRMRKAHTNRGKRNLLEQMGPLHCAKVEELAMNRNRVPLELTLL